MLEKDGQTSTLMWIICILKHTARELLTCAERWQNMVREIFTILLKSQTEENKKATTLFAQATFSE